MLAEKACAVVLEIFHQSQNTKLLLLWVLPPSAVRSFTPFSPTTFLRFMKEKIYFYSFHQQGQAKTLGLGCDNNQIPYLEQLQQGLVKPWYHHSINLMSGLTSKNFLIKVCPGSRLRSAVHACEVHGRLWGVGTNL